ncbi:zinc finger protein 184 [Colossoma macropomum]|uniref:zinc finger protein 184 n=1 Tax=Colossoma macropomum TaxID=42526 RepID=UPI001864D4D1|nr:zinc finger protein 184 [Colossoma macropomum]XP_036430539.1 zinc finger protein 184 [Colossoma macropomum]XP_036430540.1 zinc finger protein 184 [Colossoma macropomum]
MEVEDPISAKFQTLIESLMAKTTSEIVKVFAEVLLETRVEISRSWKEIDELKQKLEVSEEQRAEAILRSETTVSFKGETEEVSVSHESPQIAVSDASTICPEERGSEGVVQISKDTIVENPEITESSVVVHEPATSQTTPDICGVNSSITSPNHTQEIQVSQTVVKRKRGRPAKSSKVTELQKSAQTEVVSKLPLQAISVVDPQLPSSSTGIIILSKNRGKRGAVVTRKKYIQKRLASKSSITTTPTLRDRQLLNSQRPCLCCSSDQCSEQEKQLNNNPQEVLQVYTCRKCGNKFHERMQFKGHKCSTMHECNRCGQTFKNLRNLAAHRRSVQSSTKPFPYCCYLCGHMFATQCGWNMHKRIHAHSNLAENSLQDNPKPPQLTLPKELKAKVEVRLERISNAQLEAALCPKSSLLQDEKASLSSMAMVQNLPSGVETLTSSMDANVPSTDRVMSALEPSKESGSQTVTKGILGSRSGPGINENMKQSDDKMRDPVIPAASGEIQPTKKESCSISLTVPTVASEECKEGSSGGSDELTPGLNSLSRKRKMSDCNHDVYNGVFPVEKILRWRNTKGRNEVRVKWMPCSLCGAKWKNTWEPAESFTSYKDSRNEDAK